MALTEVLSACQPMGGDKIHQGYCIYCTRYILPTSFSESGHLDGDGACARDTMREEGVTEGWFIPDSEGGTRRRS